MKSSSRWSVLVLSTGVLLCSAAASIGAQSPGAARFAAGKAAFDKGDFEAASDAFGDAVKADDKNAEYHIWLGNAYAQHALRSGMITKARLAPRMRDEWIRGAMLDPTNYDAHEHLYQFYTLAPGFLGGSADRAAAEVTTMLRLNPYRATLGLTMLDIQSKRYAAAESRLHALSAAYPDSSAIPAALAAAQQNARQYDDAWATLDAAHARFPDNADIEYYIGRGAALTGTRLDAGEAALRHILASPAKLDTGRQSGAHYRLGMIMNCKGDAAGARAQYAEAVRLEPRNTEAKKALDRLGA